MVKVEFKIPKMVSIHIKNFCQIESRALCIAAGLALIYGVSAVLWIRGRWKQGVMKIWYLLIGAYIAPQMQLERSDT